MAYKDFQAAQVLTASEVDTYLMNQSVMVFANATVRGSTLTAPTEGMFTYLQDSNSFWFYDGAGWVNLGNTMSFADSAARSSALPSPTEGMMTWIRDTDELEVYNGTNWGRVVVTSDDDGITSSGGLTASNGSFLTLSRSSLATVGDSILRFQAGGTTYGQQYVINNGSGSGQMVYNSVYHQFLYYLRHSPQYAFVEGPTSGGGTGILQFTGTRSSSNGDVFSVSQSGITVNRTGRFRIDAAVRNNGGGDNYVYLGVSGNRSTLEDRGDSGWTHDHAAYNSQHIHSNYIGYVEAGWTVTLGAINGNISYNSTGWAGYIFMFYLGD